MNNVQKVRQNIDHMVDSYNDPQIYSSRYPDDSIFTSDYIFSFAYMINIYHFYELGLIPNHDEAYLR